MEDSEGNVSDTEVVDATPHVITWANIVVGSILYVIVLVTILGNLLVLVALKSDRTLRSTFNYYIVNLAVTDVAVAVSAMSFKATQAFYGEYWPFGEALCAVWIFFDYGIIFLIFLCKHYLFYSF